MSTHNTEILLKQISKDIKDIKTQNEKFVTEISELKEELKSFKQNSDSQINNLIKENKNLQEENKILKTKLEVIEKRTKKFNVILYGIKEEPNQSIEETVVANIIQNKLQIDCSEKDIRDIYRVGKSINNKTRPIVVETVRSDFKNEILAKSSKLKGTGISISLDYTSDEYRRRTFLVKYMKEARQKGQQAYLKGRKLVLDGDEFFYEDLQKLENIRSQTEETEDNVFKEEPNRRVHLHLNEEKSSAKVLRSNSRKN